MATITASRSIASPEAFKAAPSARTMSVAATPQRSPSTRFMSTDIPAPRHWGNNEAALPLVPQSGGAASGQRRSANVRRWLTSGDPVFACERLPLLPQSSGLARNYPPHPSVSRQARRTYSSSGVQSRKLAVSATAASMSSQLAGLVEVTYPSCSCQSSSVRSDASRCCARSSVTTVRATTNRSSIVIDGVTRSGRQAAFVPRANGLRTRHPPGRVHRLRPAGECVVAVRLPLSPESGIAR